MNDELFDGIDLTLPDEQLVKWLELAMNERVRVKPDGDGFDVVLSENEQRVLHEWSHSSGPLTQAVAVEHLLFHGPCDWDDLEAWALDPNAAVRELLDYIQIFKELITAGVLCYADRPRYVALLSARARQYPKDSQPIMDLCELALEGGESLELSWQESNRLLDVNDINLNSNLIVSYYERVIPGLNWGPGDPHIRPWIEGKDGWDGWRQIILLRVATWLGLDDGRLREIVQALTEAKTKDIAGLARGVLDGTVGYGDL